MEIASAHALIIQAYGGVATLAMPEDQRRAGLRERTLAAHVMTEDDEDAVQGALELGSG